MNIIRIPVLSDNYIFVLHDRTLNKAAVVDPAEAHPVLDCLESLGAKLVAIFNTHHHLDHVGGNKELLEAFPDAVVMVEKKIGGGFLVNSFSLRKEIRWNLLVKKEMSFLYPVTPKPTLPTILPLPIKMRWESYFVEIPSLLGAVDVCLRVLLPRWLIP